MTLPKWATTVTTLSKIIALIMFVSFPIMGFIFGAKYQSIVDRSNVLPSSPVYKIVNQSVGIPTIKPIMVIPADSQTPAAGICASTSGNIALMTINMDIPMPRCIKVSQSQEIQIKNNTDRSLQISLGGDTIKVNPQSLYTFGNAAGAFLAPGVHVLKSSPYAGGEIWIQK